MTVLLSNFLTPAFIGNVGPVELGVVFVIVLIVFGPGKLPEVFKAFGTGVKQFKDAASGISESEPKIIPSPSPTLTEKNEVVPEEKQLTEV